MSTRQSWRIHSNSRFFRRIADWPTLVRLELSSTMPMAAAEDNG